MQARSFARRAFAPVIAAPGEETDTRVARWPHTLVVIGIFLVLAVAGFLSNRASAGAGSARSQGSHVPMYAVLILMQWVLAAYVRRGLRSTGTTVGAITGRWRALRDVGRDLMLGMGLWACWVGIDHLLPHQQTGVVSAVLPRSAGELALWAVLAISAGIVEEFVFRGYLMRQFRALTGNAATAVMLQALLFGVSHGYQGPVAVARITMYGALFGAMALWRRSVAPCMVAHAWTDLAAALLPG